MPTDQHATQLGLSLYGEFLARVGAQEDLNNVRRDLSTQNRNNPEALTILNQHISQFGH